MTAGQVGGGPICSLGSQFSPDGKYLLAGSAEAVRAYSAATGKRVAVLHENVSGFCADPQKKTNVYVALRNGGILVWDFYSQRVIKQLETQDTVTNMVIPSGARMAYITQDTYDSNGKVMRIRLDSFSLEPNWEYPTAAGTILSTNASGTYLALACPGASTVEVISTIKHQTPLRLDTSQVQSTPVMCMALSESGFSLAVGLTSGTIIIYHNVYGMLNTGETLDSRKPTMMHWHCEGVSGLAFTRDEIYLASSGSEGVLVLWHLETLKPTFIPRLGGAITSMVINPVNNPIIGVCLQRNTIKLVNTASYQVAGGVCGMITPPRDATPKEATGVIRMHPGTGWIVVPGDNGVLQFYDPLRDKHVKFLRTLARNDRKYVEASNGVEGKPIEPRVQKIAFNADGSVMATISLKSLPCAHDGVQGRLSFWDRTASGSEPYEVNTSIDDPHRSNVSSLCCSPCDDLMVTTSCSGDFKLWAKQTKEQVTSWRCRSVGSFKGEGMGASAFSRDGTVLAIACRTYVTLWDPITLTRLGLLPVPDQSSTETAITELEFIPDTNYLVGCSSTAPILVVWDLLKMCIQWAAPLKADQLTADPTLHKFAVILHFERNQLGESAQDVIAIFSPEHSTPQNMYAQSRGPIHSLEFASPKMPLYAAAQAQENGRKNPHSPLLAILESRQFTVETGAGSIHNLFDASDSPRSTLGHAPSALELAFEPMSDTVNVLEPLQQFSNTVESTAPHFCDLRKIPTHRLPRASHLCSGILDSLVSRKRKKLEES